MKKKLQLILQVLLFIILGTFDGFAQSSSIAISYPTEAKDLTQATGQDSLTVSLNFSFSTSCATGAMVEIQFPEGVEYIPGSLATLATVGSVTLIESDLSNLNRPEFNLSGPISTGVITFIVERKADCSSPTVGKDEVYVYSCVDVAEVSEEVNSYNIISPVLSMVPPTSISGATVGATYTRSSVISNGGFGAVENVYYAIVYPDGSLESASSTNAIIANGVSIDPYSISGDTLFYQISGLALGSDLLMTNSEVINILESVIVNNCLHAENATKYLLSWGSSPSNLCVTTMATAGIVTMSSLTPTLTMTLQTVDPMNYCYEGELKVQTIRISNTGLGPATNIKIQPTTVIPAVITGTNYLDTVGGWDVKNSSGELLFTARNIVRNTNSYSSGIPEGALGTTCVLMVNRNLTSTVDLGDFVLGAGQYIDLEVKTRSRDMRCDGCAGNSSVMRFAGPTFRATGTYSNQCHSVEYTLPGTTFFRKIQAGIGQTVEHPLDVNIGEPFLFRTRVTFRTNALSETGELFYGIDLNGTGMTTTATSVMIGSESYPITIIDGNLIIGPLYYSESDKVMELELPLTSDGTECGNVTIETYTNLRYSDCSPLMRRSCDNYTLNVHCPSLCLVGGATPLSFKLKRISLGLADADNNGIPDGTGLADPTLINDHRSVNGDTLMGEWKIKVLPNSNPSDPNYGNNFTHVYIDFDLVNGSTTRLPGWANTLTPIDDITVEIYPSDGSAPIFSDVPLTMSGLRHVHYEIGPSIRGGEFLSNDSIIFRAKYRVSAMSGTNMGTSGVSSTGSNETFRTYNQVYSTYEARTSHVTEMISGQTYTCDGFNDYNLIRIIVLANSINSTNSITGCNGTVSGNISTAVSGASTTSDITFPYEVRQFSWPDEIWVYVPPGMTYRPGSNSLLFYSKPSNVTLSVPDENVIQVGRIIKIIGLKHYYQEFGGTILGLDGYARIDFTIRLDPNCSAEAGLYTAAGNGLHVGYGNHFNTEDYTYNGSVSPATYEGVKFQSAYTGGYTVALPILQLNGGGTVNNYSGVASWTVDVQNLANNSDAANGWLYIDELNSLTNVVVKNGSTTLIANANGFYELGSILRSSTKTITVEAESFICNTDSLRINLGYTCGSYPTTYESSTCIQSLWLKVQNPSSQVQLSVLRHPGGGSAVNLCETDSIILAINSAQQANLTNPYITFLPPAGISIPDGIVMVEYPRGSGLYENVTVTSISGVYRLNLNEHTGIAAQGILGTALADAGYVPAGGDRQAKIVIPINTNCDFISGSSFAFRAYGERPCGGIPIGNGTLTRSNRLYINGISTSGAATLSINLGGATTLTCGNPLTVQSTAIPLVESTQLGDTIKYIIPLGMKYDGNFTTSSSATVHVQTLLDGSEIVKIAIPEGIPSSTEIDLSFDLVPQNEGCGESTIIAEYIRSVSGLMCGTTACENSSVILSEVESDPFIVEKPELNIIAVTTTTPITVGTPVTYTIEVENTNTIADAPASTYHVEFYCGESTTPFATELFPTAVLAGMTAEGEITVVTPVTCGEGDLVTVKIQPVTFGDIEQCLCSPTEYIISEPLPIELVRFDVHQNGCDIDVKWFTGKEESFSHFILEKSQDNGRTYQAITDEIYGKGDNSEYGYIDQVTSSSIHLYRLSLVDKDKKVSYSIIKRITTQSCTLTNITMAPNPTDGFVKLDGLSKGQTIHIFNTLGQNVLNQHVTTDQQAIELNLSHLIPGAYYIKVLDMNRVSVFNEKLIKK